MRLQFNIRKWFSPQVKYRNLSLDYFNDALLTLKSYKSRWELTGLWCFSGFWRPEDVDGIFLRNIGIYRRVYTAPKPRRTSSSETIFSITPSTWKKELQFLIPVVVSFWVPYKICSVLCPFHARSFRFSVSFPSYFSGKNIKRLRGSTKTWQDKL
jgi:hypothetical protein